MLHPFAHFCSFLPQTSKVFICISTRSHENNSVIAYTPSVSSVVPFLRVLFSLNMKIHLVRSSSVGNLTLFVKGKNGKGGRCSIYLLKIMVVMAEKTEESYFLHDPRGSQVCQMEKNLQSRMYNEKDFEICSESHN